MRIGKPDPPGGDAAVHQAIAAAAADLGNRARGAIDRIGLPAILKTRRFGYDGKGQARLTATDVSAASSTVADERTAQP